VRRRRRLVLDLDRRTKKDFCEGVTHPSNQPVRSFHVEIFIFGTTKVRREHTETLVERVLIAGQMSGFSRKDNVCDQLSTQVEEFATNADALIIINLNIIRDGNDENKKVDTYMYVSAAVV
jgi:hypothetical protein